MSQPTPPLTTQSRHPWAAVRRSCTAGLGLLIVLSPALPDIVRAYGLDITLPWVAAALGVAAAITRILAIPAVEVWLKAHLPLLAAAPARKD